MNRKLKIAVALATAILLVSVVYAASAMNPTTQYVGQGDPTGTSYRDGDTYIDTISLNMWIFNGTSDTWTTLARFMQPPVNGTNGENGATWWLTTQDPTTLPDFGNNYDFCLDNNTWNVWYKISGQWQLTGNIKGSDGINGINGTNGIDGINGTNGTDGKDGINGTDGINGIDGINGTNGVDGKDGLNGTDGKDGSMWYNDLAYVFSEDLGNNGDYFMFANGTVEYKTNGTWVFFTNLMGQRGDTGATGPAGANGADGVDGIDGLDGINGVNGINGTNGIDGKDGINGRDGINGTDGTYGINGINGQDGMLPWWVYGVAAVALGASVYSINKSRQKPIADDFERARSSCLEKHGEEMRKKTD